MMISKIIIVQILFKLSKNKFRFSDEEKTSNYNILNINLSNGLNPNQSSWDKITNLACRTYKCS